VIMQIPTEAWNAINTYGIALNTFGVLLIAIFSYLQSKRLQKVKEIVDGPLSLALASNADLAKQLAAISGDPRDIKRAAEAAAVNKNREEGKEIMRHPLEEKAAKEKTEQQRGNL